MFCLGIEVAIVFCSEDGISLVCTVVTDGILGGTVIQAEEVTIVACAAITVVLSLKEST